VTDDATGVSVRSDFHQSYPFIGLAVQSQQQIGSQVLEHSSQQWSYASYSAGVRDTSASLGVGKYYRVFNTQSTQRRWDLNGAYVSGSRTSHSDIDDYNNIGRVLLESLDANANLMGYSTLTVNQYYNDPSQWNLGRLQRSQVTHTRP